MILIPAIDLKEGHCVRLRQGNMDESTVFSEDPVSMAAKWAEQGCTRLHLVDLDGAFEGEPVNADVIEEICTSFPDMAIQIGGGIGKTIRIDIRVLFQVEFDSFNVHNLVGTGGDTDFIGR